MSIAVGSKVWVFDQNRRVYRKDANGRTIGGRPIRREQWKEEVVVGETSRSWLVGPEWAQRKIPKKGEQPWDICCSEEELDRRSYVEENRTHIADAVRQCKDFDLLHQIATLVQYVEPIQ